MTIQEGVEQHKLNPLDQAKERRDSPLQPPTSHLPSMRPGLPTVPRNSHPPAPDARPEQDRLAFLADVAHADHDWRPAS